MARQKIIVIRMLKFFIDKCCQFIDKCCQFIDKCCQFIDKCCHFVSKMNTEMLRNHVNININTEYALSKVPH